MRDDGEHSAVSCADFEDFGMAIWRHMLCVDLLRSQNPSRYKKPSPTTEAGDSHIHLKEVVNLHAYLLPVMLNIEKATRCTT